MIDLKNRIYMDLLLDKNNATGLCFGGNTYIPILLE